jgi:hypothetical protein
MFLPLSFIHVKHHAKLKRAAARLVAKGEAANVDDMTPAEQWELQARLAQGDHRHWTNRARTKFKILASFYQITSQFESVLNVRFPPIFENFLRAVGGIVNLDVLNLAKVGCFMESNAYQR